MTEQTYKPIILTIDEFLEEDFTKELLNPVLFLVYQQIPEVKNLVKAYTNELGEGYCFADIQNKDEKLYNRIRIVLTLNNDNRVTIQTHLADEE